MKRYDFKAVESKWQKYWEENQTFKTDVWDFSKPKYYALDMFPYPSGVGLHAGHPEGYTATDIMSRMKRMQGYNVLYPMGWDAFGLPTENYAIKKVRGRKASIEEMVNMLSEEILDSENQIIYITHSDCEEDAKLLGSLIEAKMKVKGIVYGPIGPIVGSSVGPGAIAIGFKGTPVNI